MKEIPEGIEIALAALFAGEATAAEIKALREWSDASDDNCEALNEYRALQYALTDYRRRDCYDVDNAWLKHFAHLSTKSPQSIVSQTEKPPLRKIGVVRRRLYAFCRYAAVFLLAFAAGILAMRLHPVDKATNGVATIIQADETEALASEYVVPYGSKSMVILPDSSQVWLNAGSKLRYSQAFNQTCREVHVEGEAYFKVTRDETKPFLVKTAAVTLKVLGTSFNVKAYPEENNIETTVESGSVQVLPSENEKSTNKLVLTAGQKMTVVKPTSENAPTKLPQATPVSASETLIPAETVVDRDVMTQLYTSWKDSCWLIKKETLASLAVKLERRYNVQITLEGEALKKISFSGTLKDESIEQVLEAIKLSAPVNYAISRNHVKLSINKHIN